MAIIFILLLPLLSSAFVVLPSYHQVPMQTSPLLYLLPPRPQQPSDDEIVSTVDANLVYSALPTSGRTSLLEIPFLTKTPKERSVDQCLYLNPTRPGPRNIDICYFLGQDIFTSHVRCNSNWADGTNEGVRRYINEFTFQTSEFLGNNFNLTWKEPYVRTEKKRFTEENILNCDLQSVAREGCDLVVFMLFNQFNEDCSSTTPGHTFGGKSKGGLCEVSMGRGYAHIVDQGYLGNNWTGPQILAHHLLLMLTSDVKGENRHCPLKGSLLYPKLDAGNQRVDECVVKKLQKSKMNRRPCLQD